MTADKRKKKKKKPYGKIKETNFQRTFRLCTVLYLQMADGSFTQLVLHMFVSAKHEAVPS